MAGETSYAVTVVVKGAWANGRSGRYLRPAFVGITIAEAIRRLNGNDKRRGGLTSIFTTDPYLINGETVNMFSERILQAGDILTCDDP